MISTFSSIFIEAVLYFPGITKMEDSMLKRGLFLLLLGLAGCFQARSEDDDLRTIPITNNPYVVPNYGSGLPMMGGQG